jgi:hypothetical protein
MIKKKDSDQDKLLRNSFRNSTYEISDMNGKTMGSIEIIGISNKLQPKLR